AVLVNIIIKMFRQQHRRLAIQTFDKSRHEQPPHRIRKLHHHPGKRREFSHTLSKAELSTNRRDVRLHAQSN
ncbi:MAG: hypothetical protein AB8B71_08150, partial [Paracoccaceae bacterium]